MTRKKLLNVTSTKKKDNMLCATNIVPGSNDGSPNYFDQPAVLYGGRNYIIPWICTARTAEAGSPLQASRTKTEVYWRGVKERIQIQTNNGTPWQWRRIGFCSKRPDLRNSQNPTFSWARQTAANNGWDRIVNDIVLLNSGLANSLLDLMFDGTQGVDWNDYFTAKLDKEQISVYYDRTFTFNPGNDNGVMKNFSLWHSMNKNMQYDDDENGGGMNYSPYSTTAKRGMGDYYIVDIIESGMSGDTDDRLTFHPQATAYWHEK